MAPKPGEDDKDRKALAEDATSTLASVKNSAEKAMKMAIIVTKTPNAEAMKTLVNIIDDLVGDADELKKSLKDMKALTK